MSITVTFENERELRAFMMDAAIIVRGTDMQRAEDWTAARIDATKEAVRTGEDWLDRIGSRLIAAGHKVGAWADMHLVVDALVRERDAARLINDQSRLVESNVTRFRENARAEINQAAVCLRAFADRRDVSRDDKALLRLRAERLEAIVKGKS